MASQSIRDQFLGLKTQRDIADLLEVELYKLIHLAFELNGRDKYRRFSIPKKAGGVRHIVAPTKSLMAVQRRLNHVLQEVYEPKASVKGFVLGRNIVDNARMHKRRRWVLNIDLKDFFPAIHYGRVRGLLRARPYSLPKEVTALIGQLCCAYGRLSQGALTSPVLSNMICSRMDSELRRLAQSSRAYYTRYADDITFSTSLANFPSDLAYLDGSGALHVGDDLKLIIEQNGFEINETKVRLQHKRGRQEVTGLPVNEFPNVQRKYVRQIRAMLHAWKKHGLEAADVEYNAKYAPLHQKDNVSFKAVVKGKLEFLRMVKGGNDDVYRNYHDRYIELAQVDVPKVEETPNKKGLLVITEGRTDSSHLRAALVRFQEQKRFIGLDIEFHKDEGDMGDGELFKFCTTLSRRPQAKPTVCLFDRDKPGMVNKIVEEGEPFKDWSNGVYSFALPIPAHRKEEPNVCIEMLYSDSELQTTDGSGHRLYLSTEFDPETSRHKDDPDINVRRPPVKMKKIVDSGVYNSKGDSLALSKADFVALVEARSPGFSDFDLSGFEEIFETLEKIGAS